MMDSAMQPPEDYSGQFPQMPYMPANSNPLATNVTELTDPKIELRRFELMLKNCYEDEEGKEKSLGNPLMNQLGINSVMTQIGSVVSRVTFLSRYEKEEIPRLMLMFSDGLIQDLTFNWKLYGIDPNNRNTIRTKVKRTAELVAFPAMKRAYEGATLRLISSITQDMTVKMLGQNDSKASGWLSKLNPWKDK